MKKLFLLIGLTVTFSYSQVTDENGTSANGTASTNLTGNIGIGITPSSSSLYKLEVNGKTRFLDNLLIGDPNGAGKTTASFTILPEIFDCKEFVNADEIARGISPFNPDLVAF
tara:strand:- start:569 stop:907 length:339 start_codon:yes stop_codon:yes gene_type:complete